jgi:hypothetical protein
VRSSTHGGRPPTAVREQRRRHPMSGRCPNGDRLCHFAAPSPACSCRSSCRGTAQSRGKHHPVARNI